MDIKFTPREISILKEVIAGKNYREISETLFISIATVKHYMGKIQDKLGIKGKVNIILHIFANDDLRNAIKNEKPKWE